MDSQKPCASNAHGLARKFLNRFSPPAAPVVQQTAMKQKLTFPAPGWTMLRQFTCKQFYSQGNVAQVTQEKIFFVKENKHNDYFGMRRRNSRVSRDADIKSASSPKNLPALVDKASGFERVKLWLKCSLVLLIVAYTGMFLSTLIGSNSDNCKYTFRTGVLEKVLKYKLYGQEQASREIISNLRLFWVSEGPRVETMVFYGNTGIGKSYAASLIGKYFMWPRNVQHLIPSLHDHSISHATEVVSNLSLCGDNLIVVDGLSLGQEDIAVKFRDEISAASSSSGFRVIVILVFSGQQSYSNSRLKIENAFKFKADVILFQPLDEQHIMMCVREALSQQGKVASQADVEYLLSVLVPLGTGCKSVASKVNSLSENLV